MNSIKFAWDNQKALSNKKKHGIDFSEAKTVFFDENAKVIDDPEHSDTKDRFIILGLSSYARTLVVCHCYQEANRVIRIISARKATKNKSKQYGGHRS